MCLSVISYKAKERTRRTKVTLCHTRTDALLLNDVTDFMIIYFFGNSGRRQII